MPSSADGERIASTHNLYGMDIIEELFERTAPDDERTAPDDDRTTLIEVTATLVAIGLPVPSADFDQLVDAGFRVWVSECGTTMVRPREPVTTTGPWRSFGLRDPRARQALARGAETSSSRPRPT